MPLSEYVENYWLPVFIPQNLPGNHFGQQSRSLLPRDLRADAPLDFTHLLASGDGRHGSPEPSVSATSPNAGSTGMAAGPRHPQQRRLKEVDKYRNESSEDVKKPSEIAQPVPTAKTGDECKIEMPQKIKPPEERVDRLLRNFVGRARPACLTSCNPTRRQIAQEDPLETPPSMLLLPDLTPQPRRSSAVPRKKVEPTEGTSRVRSRSRSRKLPLSCSPVQLTQTRRTSRRPLKDGGRTGQPRR